MLENIHVLGRQFSFYQILVTVGILVMGWYALRRARKQGLDANRFLVFLLVAGAGVILGMHLLYAATVPERWALLGQIDSFQSLITNVYLVFGGSVFYGGLLFGMAAGLLYLRAKKLPAGPYADIMAAGVPLFHTFGRIGCFVSGCCYGIESRFGVTYHHALAEQANGVSRFPVQLAEAVCNALLFLLFHLAGTRGRCRGRLFALYLMSYSAIRFLLEFLRGDTERGIFSGLSVSQWISLALFPCAAAAFFLIGRGLRRQAIDESRII